MVGRGAQNFILLSRSGAQHNKAACDMIEDLKQQGVTIEAPQCDITEKNTMLFVINKCSISLPPIKGCIQASMVIKVLLFQPLLVVCWLKLSSGWSPR